MNLENYDNVYFLGIGGIGMSALARWFNVNEFVVSGYDKTQTALTDALEEEEIFIHFDDNIDRLPKAICSGNTLVIYTPAIPESSHLFQHFVDSGITMMKRAQVLGLLTKNMKCVAVAGTHGKTTTSSMIAHILKNAGLNCAAFLGGITQNYKTNFLLNDVTQADPVVVVEADEYDRSFLHLSPDVAVITSIEVDHLDIYKDAEDFSNTFREFVSKIDKDGNLIVNDLVRNIVENNFSGDIVGYGIDNGKINAKNLRIEDAKVVFDYKNEELIIDNCSMSFPGRHNVENAIAAISAALQLGVSPEKIQEGLASFKGVKRRFEYHINNDRILIDDYAHHPTEVRAFISAVKEFYPNESILVIFQPHLFSRTQDFMSEFAEALSLADEIVLLDIYPARELPIEGVHASVLLDIITAKKKCLVEKSELEAFVKDSKAKIVATVGAGDIDKEIDKIKMAMTSV